MEIKKQYVICIDNKDCDDLEIKKVYQVLKDDRSEEEGYLRIIDESGEDYIYPESYFTSIDLPSVAYDAFEKIASQIV